MPTKQHSLVGLWQWPDWIFKQKRQNPVRANRKDESEPVNATGGRPIKFHCQYNYSIFLFFCQEQK